MSNVERKKVHAEMLYDVVRGFMELGLRPTLNFPNQFQNLLLKAVHVITLIDTEED